MSSDEMKPAVEESTIFDNCVGKVDDSVVPVNTADILFDGWDGIDEPEWKKLWKGMPEFVQEDKLPFMKISISFRTEEDYNDFAKLIEQNLTTKTKSIWYPKLERDANFLKRWIEEE